VLEIHCALMALFRSLQWNTQNNKKNIMTKFSWIFVFVQTTNYKPQTINLRNIRSSYEGLARKSVKQRIQNRQNWQNTHKTDKTDKTHKTNKTSPSY
jgi:hypothetical protein